MKSLEENEFIKALLEAYALGAYCAKTVNSKSGWTPNKTKQERAALDRILKSVGAKKLTDEEYKPFTR